ncbi:MAG: hypothetical protein HYY06_31150 [Deltaproteobacteria bacterium]|nr:hypothetical protein [Deltaproteobacteria bacterium]
MQHYREVSSAQILLIEPDATEFLGETRSGSMSSRLMRDTAHFMTEVRSGSLSRLMDELGRWLARLSRPDVRRRVRGAAGSRPWRRPGIAIGAFVLLTAGVALCFAAALGPTEPDKPLTARALPVVGSSAPEASRSTEPREERIIDSEPHGALVFRGEDLIGTTPFVYDTPADRPLGTIRLRLQGYVPEERLVGPGSPAVVLVKLRAR